MRVREFALQYGVEPADIVNAGSLLGFPVADPSSEIDPDAFTAAVKHLAEREREIEQARERHWSRKPYVLAAAAWIVVGGVVAAINLPSGSNGDGRTTPLASGAQSVAAYRADLRTTYESTVGRAADYRALVATLSEITPPAELKAEHAELLAEAESVASLADTGVPAGAPDITAAAAELQGHLEALTAAPAP